MKILFVFLFMFHAHAFASEAAEGGQEGNGGDVVVCPDGRAELLDFYEARVLRSIEIPSSPGSDYREILRLFLTGQKQKFPGLVAELDRELGRFEAEALFLEGVQLTDISDSRHIALPTGCRVEQIAIQRAPVYPQDKRYTVSLDLWRLLSPQHQAGLVLHELLYKLGLEAGITHSMDIRYLNSILFAGIFSELSDRDRYEVLFNARQPVFDVETTDMKLVLSTYVVRTDCGDFVCQKVASRMDAKFDDSGLLQRYELNLQSKLARISYSNGFELSLPVSSDQPNFEIPITRERSGFVVELKDLGVHGQFNGKRFRMIRPARLAPEGICGFDGRYHGEGFFRSEDLDFSFRQKGCLEWSRLITLLSSPTYAELLALGGDSGLRYLLPVGRDINEVFATSSGIWAYQESTERVKLDGSSAVFPGAAEWRHPRGVLYFKPKQIVYIEENGDPTGGQVIQSFSGRWRTSFGLELSGKFLLHPSFEYGSGKAEVPYAYAGPYVNVTFQRMDFTNEYPGEIVILEDLSGRGTALVQGKAVALKTEGASVYMYPDGKPRAFRLIETVKLKNDRGKEKVYKASPSKPLTLYLDIEGRVVEES